jgi:hypothetical protein
MSYEWFDSKRQAIRRIADSALIPVDNGNRDYRNVLEWMEQGNTLQVPYVELETTKALLHRRVDDDAEMVRLRYITPGSGMAMTYAEKRDQAAAVHAAGETAANAMTADQARDAYPTLAASIGIEAPTLWACAQLVIAKAEAWADLSYGIERVRMLGKKAISDASDAAAAQAAYEAIAWPT